MNTSKFTTCARDCYDACGMEVIVDHKDEILRIKADAQHPITQGFLCSRGNKDIVRLMSNRVEQPYVRVNNTLEPTDFGYALDLVASKINEILQYYSNKNIVYLDFAGNEGLVNNIFVRRLWHHLGVMFTDQALCTTSGHFGIGLHYGKTYGMLPQDFAKQKLIIFWGANPMNTAVHIWKMAIEARKKNNARIVVVDVVETKTARESDFFIHINPHTDILLAYALMKILVDNGLIDYRFIEDYTSGFAYLKEYLQSFDISFLAQKCGVGIENVYRLSEMIVAAQKSLVVMIGIGLQKRHNGFEQVRAISLLPALVGVHRGFLYSNSQSLLVDTDYISGRFLNKNYSTIPMVGLADYIEAMKVKMIYINSMNPVVSLPNSNKLIDAIKRNNVFVVVNETHWSETAKMADVVLSVPTFLEKSDVMLSWTHNYVRKSDVCSRRFTKSLEEYEIMQLLASKIGVQQAEVFENPECVVKKAFEKALDNVDVLRQTEKLSCMKVLPQNQYQTPSNKIEFFSTIASKYDLDGLPKIAIDDKLDNEFWLVTQAHPNYTNSQFTEVFGDVDKKIRINSFDAQNYGIMSGDVVEVYNEMGELFFEAQIDDSVKVGVVALWRFVKDLKNKTINVLVNNQMQLVSYGPVFHSTKVRIKKVL